MYERQCWFLDQVQDNKGKKRTHFANINKSDKARRSELFSSSALQVLPNFVGAFRETSDVEQACQFPTKA